MCVLLTACSVLPAGWKVWKDLEYLQDVILNDSLGLGESLEQQMAHIISTYECEWKATINDQEKLKRFRQFVNSDEEDKHIQFIEERGQIRPARQEEKQYYEVSANQIPVQEVEA